VRLVARLAMVPMGEEMPAADGGDAEVSPSLEEKQGSMFGGCGQLLQISMKHALRLSWYTT
jgi:hypothetical protein